MGPNYETVAFAPDRDLLNDGLPVGWGLLHPERASHLAFSTDVLQYEAENPPTGQNWAWFEDFYGSLLYRTVTGNFAVAIRLRVNDSDMPNAAPTGGFNAGGFVIRDPAGTHNGDENWLMYNMGTQAGSYAREVKKTVSSSSGLYLNPQPLQTTGLLVCRVGALFSFWSWQNGAWVAERFEPGVTNNQAMSWPEVDETGANPIVFDHGAMPQTVQVGLMTAAWTTAGPGDTSRTRSRIEWMRFASQPPQSVSDCLGPAMSGN